MYAYMEVPAHAVHPGDQLPFWSPAPSRMIWLVVLRVGHSHCGTQRWFHLANDAWVDSGADQVVETKKAVCRDRELVSCY